MNISMAANTSIGTKESHSCRSSFHHAKLVPRPWVWWPQAVVSLFNSREPAVGDVPWDHVGKDVIQVFREYTISIGQTAMGGVVPLQTTCKNHDDVPNVVQRGAEDGIPTCGGSSTWNFYGKLVMIVQLVDACPEPEWLPVLSGEGARY